MLVLVLVAFSVAGMPAGVFAYASTTNVRSATIVALNSSASGANFQDFIVYVVDSLAGMLVIVCGGLVLRTLLKRRYAKSRNATK